MRIVNLKTGTEIAFKSWKFPGGEIGFRIESNPIFPEVRIIQRIQSSDDLIELLMATDALRNLGVKVIKLNLPYLPYARQDRIMVTGESLSIKVIANIINSQNYNNVELFDPHSPVSLALINNIVYNPVDQYEFAAHCLPIEGYTLVSPDAGATKKIEGLAKFFNYKGEIVTGQKHRELSTGKITHTSVDVLDLTNKNCVIVDDICDGGRTFIELAKVLKGIGAEKVILIVSHGIFSAGFEPLAEYIDEIYTTNSFRDINPKEYENIMKVHVSNLF